MLSLFLSAGYGAITTIYPRRFRDDGVAFVDEGTGGGGRLICYEKLQAHPHIDASSNTRNRYMDFA